MMNNLPSESWLTPDDRSLIRSIASHLRAIMEGSDVQPLESGRMDELGILANMAGRVTRELHRSRRRDAQHRLELEQRLAELQAAHEVQQEMLSTIKELSTPILNIYQGVLLLPIVGALDTARTSHVIDTLLDKIAGTRAQVVILDVTGVPRMDSQVADVLIQAARAAALLGSKVILCGISPAVAHVVISLGIDLRAMTPAADLQAALAQALALLGCQIVCR
jgi:rsbT co-antagonist protein RsbR